MKKYVKIHKMVVLFQNVVYNQLENVAYSIQKAREIYGQDREDSPY